MLLMNEAFPIFHIYFIDKVYYKFNNSYRINYIAHSTDENYQWWYIMDYGQYYNTNLV